MMLAGRGIAKVITGGQNTTATNEPFRRSPTVTCSASRRVRARDRDRRARRPASMRRTALGLMIESIGINPKASRLAGIRRGRS